MRKDKAMNGHFSSYLNPGNGGLQKQARAGLSWVNFNLSTHQHKKVHFIFSNFHNLSFKLSQYYDPPPSQQPVQTVTDICDV